MQNIVCGEQMRDFPLKYNIHLNKLGGGSILLCRCFSGAQGNGSELSGNE